jgi:hypothetical protein
MLEQVEDRGGSYDMVGKIQCNQRCFRSEYRVLEDRSGCFGISLDVVSFEGHGKEKRDIYKNIELCPRSNVSDLLINFRRSLMPSHVRTGEFASNSTTHDAEPGKMTSSIREDGEEEAHVRQGSSSYQPDRSRRMKCDHGMHRQHNMRVLSTLCWFREKVRPIESGCSWSRFRNDLIKMSQ